MVRPARLPVHRLVSSPGCDPIASRRHPIVERCRALARQRRAEDALLLDGAHLLEAALEEGWPLELVVFSIDSSPGSGDVAAALDRVEAAGVDTLAVTRRVMEAMSPVKTPTGLLAIARPRTFTLEALVSPPPALVVCAVDVQDPGNLGAIVRSAEAFGATGVLCAGECADPFGWKALRGSMGSALRVPLRRERRLTAAIADLRGSGLGMAVTVADGAVEVEACDWRRPLALLVGNEGAGVPEEVMASADVTVRVPMQPRVDSLNVAVATGVVLYEAQRQRRARGGR